MRGQGSRKPHNHNNSKKGIAKCPYCETKKRIVVWEEDYFIHRNCWHIAYKNCRYKCTIFCWIAYGGKGCGRHIVKYANSIRKARELCVQAWNDPYGEI